MGACILINGLTFIAILLTLLVHSSICGFALYLAWRYLDTKYFSTAEIELLKQENEYLKQENKKVNGSSSDFWKEN